MSTDINQQRILIIEYWFRILMRQNVEISINDIIPIIIKYHQQFKILTFHSTFKSQGVILSDCSKCATKKREGNLYVLADDDPVKTGIHVWRVKVK